MVRNAYNKAAILDAEAVSNSRVVGKDESGWVARLAQHRVERLKPILARHGGRAVDWPGGSDRAEFASAAAALGAAIEFQQAVADANQGEPEDAAVVFRLRLGLDDEEVTPRLGDQERPGGIVVSARLRDAAVGRVPASFAELGRGLGTVDRPVHVYEVGWDPADWPAESAVAASAITSRDDGAGLGRRIGAIAWVVLLLGGAYLAVAPRPAGWRQPTTVLDLARLQGHAEEAVARWRVGHGEPSEPDDEAANADNAGPIDAYDGLYAGTTTTRADGRLVSFKLKVTDGIGLGTQSQRECGTAPIRLKVSPSGDVSGLALMFGSTCLKTEMAIRGRAVGDTLLLRLGNQPFELAKPND